ncbi:MAG: acetylglutamate kinase [Thermoguttaceae bacterium]|nr:acetylglutamate kinase [Thermoguttaceae bacterium]
MRDAIEKADVLIEALHWIRQFRGSIAVIKLGGSVMDSADDMVHLLLDTIFMESVGLQPVIIHGGGKAISRAMQEAGITPRFVQGRRYTDAATLQIVERVLAGEVNEGIAKRIEEFGGMARPLNFRTKNVLTAKQITLSDEAGNPIDLGYVGRVTDVDTAAIRALCSRGIVPVIPSVAETPAGQRLNINADTAAQMIAEKLGAEKLVFVSDVPGVLRDKEDRSSLIRELSLDEAQRLIDDGTIQGGMIPKVQACMETVRRGVRKVHMVDGRLRHSLLLDIYTRTGVGTVISE